MGEVFWLSDGLGKAVSPLFAASALFFQFAQRLLEALEGTYAPGLDAIERNLKVRFNG